MPKSSPKDLIVKLIEEISLVKTSQRLLITVTHCHLELLVHTLVLHRCKNGRMIAESGRDYPQSVKITLLHECNIIRDQDVMFLTWFRKRRNEAAHEVEFSITPQHLNAFKGYTASDRKTRLDLVENLSLLCQETVFGFWNQHVELFAPIFNPDLFKK